MDELIKLDNNFNKEMFISKANNIFVMLHTAIMSNNLDRVRHFISNELERKCEKVLQDFNQKNIKKIYDELNVKSTDIKNVSINGDIVTIYVDITSRYMEYFINKNTGEYVSGNDTRRIEKINHLVFEKEITSNYNGVVRKCPTCGAGIDVNESGKCDYCKTIFDAENHDWILTSIEIEN